MDIESDYSNEREAVMHVSNVVTDLIKTESILRAAPQSANEIKASLGC